MTTTLQTAGVCKLTVTAFCPRRTSIDAAVQHLHASKPFLAPNFSASHFKAASALRDDPEVAELLKAADALMSQLGTSENRTKGDEEQGGENKQQQRIMKLVCDESSCVIVPVAEAASQGPEGSFIASSGQGASEASRPRDFLLSEGEGWKLGYDRDPVTATAFTALVGSDTWNISLTKQEFTDFVQLLRKLQRSIATLQTCGEWGGPRKPAETPNETAGRSSAESSLELQTDRIWMQARAPQKQLFDLTKVFQQGFNKGTRNAAFHLRFIVRAPQGEKQREFEGHFSPEAVMRLLEHLETYPPALDSLDEQQQSSTQEGSRAAVAGYIG